MWPVPNLMEIAGTRGVSLVTLGFIQATPDGTPGWAGLCPAELLQRAGRGDQSVDPDVSGRRW